MVKYTHLEPPLLRVSRPVSACSRCRAAKIKCDGKLPACTACERTGREAECSSANDQFAKGKERSYVAALESRVEHLEKKRRELLERKDVSSDKKTIPERPPPTVLRTKGRTSKQSEATDMDDLISDLGFMAINATSRDFYGFTSAMSFAKLVVTFSTTADLPTSFDRRLPPRQNLVKVVQHFLDKIFVFYPFLNEASIFASIDNVYQHDGKNALDRDFWVVYMILAITTSSLSRSHGDTNYRLGENYVSAALEYVESVLYPGSIYSIQACLLLTLYAMVDPSHFDSWYLIGVAVRVLVDLGWHQDPPKQYSKDEEKLNTRRKVFYCVYAIDSMIHARPSTFSDHTTSVAFPAAAAAVEKRSTWMSSSTSIQPALHLFRLRQLQSAWYQTLFHSSATDSVDTTPYVFAELAKLRQWWSETPDNLPSETQDSFKLELLYSYVYLLAPTDRHPDNTDVAKELTFEYAIEFASIIRPLAHNENSASWFTFHDALRCYFVGRQFLESLLRGYDKLTGKAPMESFSVDTRDLPLRKDKSNNATRALDTLDAYIDVLAVFGRRWMHGEVFREELSKKRAFLVPVLKPS